MEFKNIILSNSLVKLNQISDFSKINGILQKAELNIDFFSPLTNHRPLTNTRNMRNRKLGFMDSVRNIVYVS
jgi:hypothetical protein